MCKPEWKDAPEWANWIAQDKDGSWWWYEDKPKPRATGEFIEVSHQIRRVETLVENNNWKKTLERRPMLTAHERAMLVVDQLDLRIDDATVIERAILDYLSDEKKAKRA